MCIRDRIKAHNTRTNLEFRRHFGQEYYAQWAKLTNDRAQKKKNKGWQSDTAVSILRNALYFRVTIFCILWPLLPYNNFLAYAVVSQWFLGLWLEPLYSCYSSACKDSCSTLQVQFHMQHESSHPVVSFLVATTNIPFIYHSISYLQANEL